MMSLTWVNRGSVATTLLVLLLATSLPRAAEASTSTNAETDLACSVNTERARIGLSPLRVNSELTRIARQHSVNMADQSRMFHNPNLTSDVTNWKLVAENVSRGPSAIAIHQAFMDSASHRSNILNSRVTEIGVGVEIRNSTLWVTQIFRDPSVATSGQLPSCGSTSVSSSGSTSPGIPVRGDWNGNGQETLGWFSAGRWELSNGLSGRTDLVVSFGREGDIPVVGDWDGSGRDTLGVVRDDTWLLRNDLSGGPAQHSFRYGRITRGDVPIVGDWRGDGRDTIGIIRDGEWHLRHSLSGGPGQTVFTYGRVLSGDVPIIGDWNGSGRSGVGIVRGSDWHLRNTLSGGHAEHVVNFG